MKKIFFALGACVCAVVYTSTTAVFAQIPWHLDPTVASVGKEPARGDVVSHDGRAAAVARIFGKSKYLQPLDKWTRTETAESVDFTTRFKVPFEWVDRRQILHVAHTSGSFAVAVGDSIVAYSQTGSTPSEFDITAVAREGANTLTIKIFKDPAARLLESGRPVVEPRIDGEVYILSQPRVRVRDVSISTRVNGSDGLLQLGVIMKSHQLNPHKYQIHWELLNAIGEIVADGRKDVTLDMRREDTVHFFARIPRVVPWSHEDPRLYTLAIKTQNEGRFREYLAFRVGFRSFGLDSTGHLDPTGRLVFVTAPTREFLATCDSMGIHVACMADIDTRGSGPSRRVGGNPSNDPAWSEAYIDRTLAMYHNSKNHPSVAMFALGTRSANGINLYDSYLALKALEPHRPVVYADAAGEWNSDPAEGFSLHESAHPTPPHGGGPQLAMQTEAPLTPKDWLTLEAVSLGAVVGAGGGAVVGAAAGRGADGGAGDKTGRGEALIKVTNTRQITTLTGELHYKIISGRSTVSSGVLPLEVLPGESAELTIPIAGVKAGKGYVVEVEIAVERADGNFLPPSDPNLRVYRRLDLPLSPANRVTVAAGRFESGGR